MQQGIVKQCPHCFGTGTCRRGDVFQQPWLSGVEACPTCAAKAGLNQELKHKDVVCSVCAGQCEVWSGPPQQY